jgi:branched-subunit amino acid ABC-type transport system permease component
MQWNVVGAVFIGIAAGAVLGVIVEICIFRGIRNRGSSPVLLFVASLGTLVVVQNALSLVYGDNARSLRVASVAEGYSFAGMFISGTEIAVVILSIGLTLLTWSFLHHSLAGRNIRALADHRFLAAAVGIDVDKTFLLVAIVASVLGSVAGIVIALDRDLVPSMGFSALLLGASAAVVGGIGRIQGSLVGGICLGLAQHLGVLQLSSQWQDAIVFSVAVLFLVVRPFGILGSRPPNR